MEKRSKNAYRMASKKCSSRGHHCLEVEGLQEDPVRLGTSTQGKLLG
uniref:Uncharacterized protein n=1 Tax=Nelumbo nucifera TaxID=4432 RepID=A0A822Y8H9_NELNU|nr:TPA_asm: hypothetical protein HUJ06_029831 [Nelumbo nucifera]